MIHATIVIKYQKYPPILILTHLNVLAELNKLQYVHLYNVTPYKEFTVLNCTHAK